MGYAMQHRFRVTVGESVWSFSKISNIEMGIEYEILREGGNNLAPRILPMPQKALKTVRLERGVQTHSKETESVQTLYAGMPIEQGIGITILDAAGLTVAEYTLQGATVVKWEIGAWDAQSNQVLIETFEIAYTGIKRE